MGPFRQPESSHAGYGFGPKLTVTGRLFGTLAGRPVEIVADERQWMIRLAGIRDAWQLRRAGSPNLRPIMRWLRRAGMPLNVLVGARLRFQLLPEPGLAAKLFAPGLIESDG